MNYIVMICDIKNSRGLDNREYHQNKIIEMLREANKIFKNFIASDFIIIIGDEWQGLLKNDVDYNSILNFFHEKINTLDFYCGIGTGEITIRNFELTVNQLDGPVCHIDSIVYL
jgi:hypothetical protein